VALAMLTALDTQQEASFRYRTMQLLDEIRSMPLSARDDLCCGNSGRLDVLVQASRVFDDPSLLTSAREIAGQMLERAHRKGSYALVVRGATTPDLRLFSGISGVGYALLRVSSPNFLPCILALS
jgi:lantibiotic modifying enzyme